MEYKHFPNRPGDLTDQFVKDEYDRLIARIEEAEADDSPQKWIELYEDWNALKSFIGSEGARRHYDLSKNMSDEEIEKREEYFRKKVSPASQRGELKVMSALLESKHRDAVGKRFGPYLIEHMRTGIEPLADVNSDLRVQEGDLINEYDKIVAAGEVEVNGKTVTLAVARSMVSSEDAEIRKAAFTAHRDWFVEHHDELAEIFDKLVKTRDQMAKNLGHDNFIRLGYLGMGRTDYGVDEAATFRAAVRKYAVPLYERLTRMQAEALGTETLRPWDSAYDPSLSLPSGIAPVDTQLEKAQNVFDKLSERLGGHFRRMRDEGLIDLENRKGKRAGAFCTSFPDEGRVAILCNSTGDQDDVGTLMHEMGHAFQGWESMPIEAVDLQWPTSDACEVHSMGMEYLSLKYMNEFFSDEDAEKFRKDRWKGAVRLICYISVVDEFQHWVYENPNASFEERDAEWRRLTATYMPGIDYSGLDEYNSARWYAQGHLFWMPFYYIDYGIAETGAMQLGMMDEEDPEKAMETYLKLCQMGGTKSVLNIFKSAGLRSPFEPDLIKDLMEHAAKEIGVEPAASA